MFYQLGGTQSALPRQQISDRRCNSSQDLSLQVTAAKLKAHNETAKLEPLQLHSLAPDLLLRSIGCC